MDTQAPRSRHSETARRSATVDRVIEQLIERVLERPGQELPRQVNGE